MSRFPSIGILTGPTATGKTEFALRLARKHREIEIVNADSLLVYRGLDIGTAKPAPAELAEVPHHLIDIRNPDEPFTAGEFFREAQRALQGIEARGKRALIVGGTGFYIKALLFGLWQAPAADPAVRERLSQLPDAELYSRLESRDAASALRIGPRDRYRLVRALELIELTGKTPSELQAEAPSEPDPRFELWVVDRPQAELDRRIAARTQAMLDAGLLEEVRRIRERFPSSRPLQAVGYAQACAYLDGIAPAGRKVPPGIAGLRQEIELATRQLVKGQRTFFRGFEIRDLNWFELDRQAPDLERAMERIYGA